MQERLDTASDPAAGGETASAAPSEAQPRRRRVLPVLVPVLVFAALAGLFMVALNKGDPSRIPSALIGRPAPAMTLPPVEGLVRNGTALPGLVPPDLARGKPVVVNFFASWCLPCVEEHPQLVALATATGVPIIGINHKDQPANAVKFLARHGNPYSAVGADTNGRAAIEWGVYGMPETFVVDGAGKIVFKHVGPIGEQALVQKLLPALEKAAKTEK
jgi:cytochrome c biogenesis protein CcmG/thiol:disulfide interchange protein DsbE